MSRFRPGALAFAAGLALAGAAGPAAAVQVLGATRVEVRSAVNTYLQVAELQAFEFGTLDNVAAAAEGGSASATSNYGGSAGPGAAIDGDTGGSYGFNGVYHSNGGADVLTIFLGRAANLKSLTIWGRQDCCQDRDVYDISIFNADGLELYSGRFDNSVSRSSSVTFDPPPGGGGVVPEPGAWALMMLGFGATGAALRSRRKAALAV